MLTFNNHSSSEALREMLWLRIMGYVASCSSHGLEKRKTLIHTLPDAVWRDPDPLQSHSSSRSSYTLKTTLLSLCSSLHIMLLFSDLFAIVIRMSFLVKYNCSFDNRRLSHVNITRVLIAQRHPTDCDRTPSERLFQGPIKAFRWQSLWNVSKWPISQTPVFLT